MRKKYSFSLMALLAGCVLMSACNKYVAQTDKKIETTLERIEEYTNRLRFLQCRKKRTRFGCIMIFGWEMKA